MACQTIPTSTLFATETITSFSLKTEFETSTITSPAVTTTTSTPVCASTATITLSDSVATTCASTSLSTFETTIPGETETSTLTHISTLPITFTTTEPTSTLFSTSCPPDDQTPPPTPPPTSTPPPDNKPPPTSDPPNDPPPDTTTITSGITLPDGRTSIATITYTRPSLNDPNGNAGDDGGAARAAKIGGAVVGSIAGVAILVALAFWLWKRSRRWDDIFEDSDDEAGAFDAHPGWKIVGAPVRLRHRSRRQRKPRLDLDPPTNPAPYHYGLVGSAAAMSAPAHSQTPSSPPESPLGQVVRPASSNAHTRVPSELALPPGVLGTPLFTSDPFAAQPMHPMSARGTSPSPQVSMGSSNTLEVAAAASATAAVNEDPNRSPMKAPLPPQQQQTSPVIVHQDAGPAVVPPAYRD
ncbi:hypothetical protein AURDEDRAFT_110874 [Auricularia subglabra TFB-10046 SS5]|nr:hypothetical protein AURDEDRAFT_110874 [Auricularia subglabra TFB-10046 SS5]